jgi:hypothetical protein
VCNLKWAALDLARARMHVNRAKKERRRNGASLPFEPPQRPQPRQPMVKARKRTTMAISSITLIWSSERETI